jgi:tetratricopeptide (TPR) repeat protein
MTSHIAKLFQITLTTLAIFPLALTLNLSHVRAEAPDAIGDITNITEKIARNPLAPATQDSTDDRFGAERERSMEYIKQGIEAQEAGNAKLALESYSKAIQVDESNPYAYLFAGQLIGQVDKETGINCGKAAVKLSVDQRDRECYEMAIALLKSLEDNV